MNVKIEENQKHEVILGKSHAAGTRRKGLELKGCFLLFFAASFEEIFRNLLHITGR